MPQPIKICINPLLFNEFPFAKEEWSALRQFLGEQTQGIWHSNQQYPYRYQNNTYQFTFTHSLLKRKGANKLEVFDPNQSALGQGSYGIVYPLTGSIKFQLEKPVFKNNSTKLVKIQEHRKKNKKAEVEKEYHGLLIAARLRVEPPVFIEERSYLIMDRAPGIPLEKILSTHKDDHQSIAKLTLLQRLELTKAILLAIKEQVIDKGLIHRDLKPSNLIVDLNVSPPEVTVIDFGFVIRQEEQDRRHLGTRAYRAPETFSSNVQYSPAVDVYATGRILSYLWGDNHSNYYIQHDKKWSYIKKRSTNQFLFSELNEDDCPSLEEQKKIKMILNAMLRIQPKNRFTLNEALDYFEPIYSNRVNSQLKIQELDFQIKEIQAKLQQLKAKENNLRARGFSITADLMEQLVKTLETKTEDLAANPTPSSLIAYRQSCYDQLNQIKPVMQEHRNVYWLFAELMAAIGLLGVGYMVALGVNYHHTQRWGLFSQTQSARLVEEAAELVLNLK